MECKNCKANNPDDAKFCHVCGESLTTFQRMVDLNYKGRTRRRSEDEYEQRTSKNGKKKLPEPMVGETYDAYGEGAAFNPVKRAETIEYDGTRRTASSKPRYSAPYLISVYILAALAAAMPVFSFFGRITLASGGNSGSLSLFDFFGLYAESSDAYGFFTELGHDLSLFPKVLDKIDFYYTAGLIVSIVSAAILAVALLLCFITVLLALLRRRSASSVGIVAAVFTLFADALSVGVCMYITRRLAGYVLGTDFLTVTTAPAVWISVILAVLLFIACIAVKATGKRR